MQTFDQSELKKKKKTTFQPGVTLLFKKHNLFPKKTAINADKSVHIHSEFWGKSWEFFLNIAAEHKPQTIKQLF